MQGILSRIGTSLCLLSATTAILLTGGGCGGGDSSGGGGEVTVETGSLTKSQFIERADAICIEGRSEFERKFAALGRSTSSANLAERTVEAIETVFVPAYEKQMDRISALGAPKGDEEQVASILNAIQHGVDEAKQHPVKVFQNSRPFPEATELARHYGLTGCADSFS